MVPNWRQILLRWPPALTVGAVVGVSVAASVGMLLLLNLLMGLGFGPTFKRSLTVAVVAPILVAAPISGLIVRLLREVDDARRTAQHLAWNDALTGLLNRGRLGEQAKTAIEVARAGGAPLSAVLIDLDHFKQVNDHHGHAAGDAVLRAVAATIAASVRAGDLVGRWGGEEFAVVLPGADAEQAVRVMQRLRAAVAARRVEVDGAAVGCTASIGVATLRDGDDGFDELFVRADRAMYRAKHGGKNRVMVAEAA